MKSTKRMRQGLSAIYALLACLASAGALAEPGNAALARLSRAIQIPTIYPAQGSPESDSAFQVLHRFINARFQRSAALQIPLDDIGHSRLYRWLGTDASLPQVILLAHMDVVPVDPGTEGDWEHPPFSGAIAGGSLWGRGTMDDKSNVFAQLEAVESLLDSGFEPRRAIWLAHGHDEEVDGTKGALRMAAYLKEQGVKAWFTLDEGSAVTQGIVSGVERPIAFIMAGEKGYVSLRITARAQGGHSSMPPEQTAIWSLADALTRLQGRPLPARIVPPVERMLDDLAPYMPALARFAIDQRWLFEPLVLRQLLASPTTAASVRTTMAPTMLMAGVKDNVLPNRASAVINFRLLPGDRIQDVLEHVRQAISDDTIEVALEPGFRSEAPPVSDFDAASMQVLRRAAQQVFPEAIMSTGIIQATTDNRHYAQVRENGYYFSPYPYTQEQVGLVHGTNERIGVEDYLRMIDFYKELIRLVAG